MWKSGKITVVSGGIQTGRTDANGEQSRFIHLLLSEKEHKDSEGDLSLTVKAFSKVIYENGDSVLFAKIADILDDPSKVKLVKGVKKDTQDAELQGVSLSFDTWVMKTPKYKLYTIDKEGKRVALMAKHKNPETGEWVEKQAVDNAIRLVLLEGEGKDAEAELAKLYANATKSAVNPDEWDDVEDNEPEAPENTVAE